MSEFMEWAEGDDFITEDTDVRESCESAWDAAWAQQDFRIAELKAESAKLRGLMSEALSNMEYYPASLGEYWLVQDSDITAMQEALKEKGE